MDIFAGLLLVWSYILLGRKTDESRFWGWSISTIGNSLFVYWGYSQEPIPWGILIISCFMVLITVRNTIKYGKIIHVW